MEEQLISVDGGWDQHDMLVFVFYDVTTKVPLGDVPAGTTFETACFNYETGKLVLENYEPEADASGCQAVRESHSFNLSFNVTPG